MAGAASPLRRQPARRVSCAERHQLFERGGDQFPGQSAGRDGRFWRATHFPKTAANGSICSRRRRRATRWPIICRPRPISRTASPMRRSRIWWPPPASRSLKITPWNPSWMRRNWASLWENQPLDSSETALAGSIGERAELATLKQLASQMADLQKQELNVGDNNSAENLAQMGMILGEPAQQRRQREIHHQSTGRHGG